MRKPDLRGIKVLERAKELILKGWTKEAYARRETGEQCPMGVGEQFCLMGALGRATIDLGVPDLVRFSISRILAQLSGYPLLEQFNDQAASREHVINLIEDGIVHFKAKDQTREEKEDLKLHGADYFTEGGT